MFNPTNDYKWTLFSEYTSSPIYFGRTGEIDPFNSSALILVQCETAALNSGQET